MSEKRAHMNALGYKVKKRCNQSYNFRLTGETDILIYWSELLNRLNIFNDQLAIYWQIGIILRQTNRYKKSVKFAN